MAMFIYHLKAKDLKNDVMGSIFGSRILLYIDDEGISGKILPKGHFDNFQNILMQRRYFEKPTP